jgi:ATP-dependent exoDNAse (exonuclease V) alpha subunit
LAIFHSHVQIISRGTGKSAVAAAAYRAGELIKNDYDGIIHDYTRKGGVVHTEILLPAHAPIEYSDRAVLWNAVEKIEKAENSQLARELDIALPAEFTREQNISLAREYVRNTFVNVGMCADLCIHDTGEGNPHFHLMLTMRPINGGGTWGGKQKKEYILDRDGDKIYDPIKRQYKCRSIPSTDWNDRGNADKWRQVWQDMANAELERLGFDVRIDRRTYAEQGIDKVPTVHMGVAATQMEKRGIPTERGNINREIMVTNSQLRQLKARLTKLQTWLNEEMANTEPPTLADVISNILERKQTEQSGRYGTINNLKLAANMLNFLTRNNIMDTAGLDDYLRGMIRKQFDISDKLKPIERRLTTLDEHLQQSENYKEYRSYKAQYDKLCAEHQTLKNARGLGVGRKAQKALDVANAYYETFRQQVSLCQAAEKYLRGVLQKHFDPNKLPPITKWKAEREKLISEKNRLNREYQTLKTETAEVEKIRSGVYELLSAERRRGQPKRSQGREL